ncbi:MAG: hypothetical protein JXB85_08695 [Anaerolineales bacterium]|nr:hypothetical protein [Anaerolineales bacterium]
MNKATRTNVATLGTIFGISSISHGFFETLQGNTPTDGMFISAIGEAQRMWPHGNEYAFTLVPNFLVTGLLAMLAGAGIIIWSLGFVHKKSGPLFFLLLFLFSLLVGGGVAQILFFILFWVAATRINKPLTWWRKILPRGLRNVLAGSWKWFLVVDSVLLLLTLFIAIFGYVPGVSNPDRVLSIMLACLAGFFMFLMLTLVAGFSYDIKNKPA